MVAAERAFGLRLAPTPACSKTPGKPAKGPAADMGVRPTTCPAMARILLIDDDPDQLEIRQLVLETEAYQVATATSPVTALKAFDAADPAVILMDLRLPRTEDGIQLLCQLRSRSADIPIIVLTGWPDDLKDRPERSLITHILPKPARTFTLLDLVDRLLDPR